MSRLSITAATLLASVSIAATAQARPMTPEDVAKLESVASVAISPDGTRIAYEAGGLPDVTAGEDNGGFRATLSIATAPGVDPDAIRRVAREEFDVSVAGGLGALAGRVFRIGHLGDINAPMLLGALAGVEAAMTLLKVPYGRDGVAEAVAAIARAAAGTKAGPW